VSQSVASTPTEKPQPARNTETLVPLVPREGLWEGQVAVVGETIIAGTVHGTLRGPGGLILSHEGRIEGVIDCDHVRADGVIIGPVTVRTKAHLGPGTRFEGDLEAPVLEVDDDAVWIGTARVGP
jgi:cytoskeletal protein CcmA (bactofilin family)